MRSQTYLLQRGIFRNKPLENKKGIDSRFQMDYMGSAEFEWGALPRGLRRICRNIDKYIELPIYIDGYLFYMLAHSELLEKSIEDFIDVFKGNLHLKESPRMENIYNGNLDNQKIDFWWSLDLNYMVVLDRVGLHTLTKCMLEQKIHWYDELPEDKKSDIRVDY